MQRLLEKLPQFLLLMTLSSWTVKAFELELHHILTKAPQVDLYSPQYLR